MLYTIYKTINNINGKYYIGKHQTKNINDRYFGSGKSLKKAFKVYGKENFTKEVLFVFDNEKQMNEKEKEIVNKDLVSSKLTYNAGIGGEGGPHFENRKHSDETKEKLKKIRANQTHSEDTKNKISNSLKGRKYSKETLLKLSESAKKYHQEKREKKV